MPSAPAREVTDATEHADPAAAFFDFHDGVALGAAAARTCRDCHICCKLPSISAPLLLKPAGMPCRHLQPGRGCNIYPERPSLCAVFLCGWRVLPLGEHWYPAEAGMLVTIREDAIGVSVEADAGDRWYMQPWHGDLLRLAELVFPLGRFVIVYPWETRLGGSAWVLDHRGGLSLPLELPPGYEPASLGELPVMRVRREDAEAWRALRSAMTAEPLSHLEDHGWELDLATRALTRLV